MEQRMWPPSILLTGQPTFAEERLAAISNQIAKGCSEDKDFNPNAFLFRDGSMWEGHLPLSTYILVRSEQLRREIRALCEEAKCKWQ
jgi:hypothetical protein